MGPTPANRVHAGPLRSGGLRSALAPARDLEERLTGAQDKSRRTTSRPYTSASTASGRREIALSWCAGRRRALMPRILETNARTGVDRRGVGRRRFRRGGPIRDGRASRGILPADGGRSSMKCLVGESHNHLPPGGACGLHPRRGRPRRPERRAAGAVYRVISPTTSGRWARRPEGARFRSATTPPHGVVSSTSARAPQWPGEERWGRGDGRGAGTTARGGGV